MKTQYMLMVLIFIITTIFSQATVYENGEGTSTWRIYDTTPVGASVSTVSDIERNSTVIKLESENTENGYILGGLWNNTIEKHIEWSMRTSQDYIIYVSVKTTKGHRYLVYSPVEDDTGLKGSYIHHALGANSLDGIWHTFSRDLEADLKEYESDNSLVSVDAFLVRGSGLFDDIKLISKQINTATYTVEDVDVVNDPMGIRKETNIYKNTSNGDKIKMKTIFNTDHANFGYQLDEVSMKTIENITYFLVRSTDITSHIYGNDVTHLWRTDGREAGTIKLSVFSSFHDQFLEKPTFTTYSNGKLHIEYSEEDPSSGEITYDYWETDGTKVGTVHVRTVTK